MKRLKRGDISGSIRPHYYTRGRRYFEEGRVIELLIEDEDESSTALVSTVQGRGRNRYRQHISIDWLDHGHVEIHSVCSCPVRFDCKHAAAALLEYQQRHFTREAKRKPPGKECLAWLEEFARADNEPQQGPPGRELLLYILHPASRPGRLRVEFCVTRHLKRGGYGKGRIVHLSAMTESYYPPQYLRKSDIEIGKLLEICDESNWHEIVIKGDSGFLALSRMLQSGRCHWRHIDSPPLQAGEERALELAWQRDEQENATLQIKVAGGGEPLLTAPPLYLDSATGTIGALTDVPYTPAQLEKLLQQPAVPADLVTEFSARLLQDLPATPLPPPQQMEIVELTGEPPRPALLLAGATGPEGYHHLMRLRFRYQGQEIRSLPFAEMQNIGSGARVLRVHRDLLAESSAVERIVAQGFEPVNSGDERDLNFASIAGRGPLDTAARWHRFLTETVPQLEEEGWLVESDASFHMQFHQGSGWEVEIDGDSDNNWFDLRFDVEINGRRQPLLPLITQVLDSYDRDHLPETLTLPVAQNQYLTIPSARIRPVLDVLYELYDPDTLNEDGALRMSRFDAGRLAELEQNGATDLQWRGGKALRRLGRKLNDFQGIKRVKPPRGLRATLREYQQRGLDWLQFLREYGFAGILADDMGLGKTVQTLAHLLLEKQRGRLDRPALIIAPTSLMSNWRREAEQFTPRLKVLILQGPERHQRFAEMEQYDLLLSTYPLLARDEEQLLAHDYHYLVLDEAQTIKNPRAKAAQIARRIKTRHRLCLTGTPMENHLGELWALFDFLMPGFLGDSRQFRQLFRTPIEKHGDQERRQRLARRVAPFMLRRTKAEVVGELPEKSRRRADKRSAIRHFTKPASQPHHHGFSLPASGARFA